MPELSDVILSKIELIRLISSVLKINRSAMTITNISTSSITVIPDIYFLSVKNLQIFAFYFHNLFFHIFSFPTAFFPDFLNFAFSLTCYLLFGFYILIEKNAGTITIAKTMINIKNNGIINFVPASSPAFFARFFRCSNASSASLSSNSVSPLVPFLKF